MIGRTGVLLPASVVSGRVPGMTQSAVLPLGHGAILSNTPARPKFEHEHEHEHERRTPNAKRQTRFPPLLLVTEPLSTTLLATMGGYKGRVNVKNRKRRSAKAERIKAVADTKAAVKKSD